MKKLFALVLCMACSNLYANDDAKNNGVICLAENTSKMAEEHFALHITVNTDKQKFYFTFPYKKPTVIQSHLATNKIHTVNIYIRDELVKTLPVDFKKLKSNNITVWRTAGHWHVANRKNCRK